MINLDLSPSSANRATMKFVLVFNFPVGLGNRGNGLQGRTSEEEPRPRTQQVDAAS